MPSCPSLYLPGKAYLPSLASLPCPARPVCPGLSILLVDKYHNTLRQWDNFHLLSISATSPHCTSLYIHAHHLTALHFTALYCTSLYFTSLHFTALQCTALHFTALHCISLHLNLIFQFNSAEWYFMYFIFLLNNQANYVSPCSISSQKLRAVEVSDTWTRILKTNVKKVLSFDAANQLIKKAWHLYHEDNNSNMMLYVSTSSSLKKNSTWRL